MIDGLAKGQSVTLLSHSRTGLSEVRMGLAWDTIKRRRITGEIQEVGVDLDASALLISADLEVLETVYFGHLSTADRSVEHTGDNMTGHGDGDDESITVNLGRVVPEIEHIVFVVSSYSGHNFSEIANATARLVDSADGDRELVHYTLTGSGTHTAVVMARLSRAGNSWTFTAVGVAGQAQTAHDLVALTLSTI